jgi:hypothetical protein
MRRDEVRAVLIAACAAMAVAGVAHAEVPGIGHYMGKHPPVDDNKVRACAAIALGGNPRWELEDQRWDDLYVRLGAMTGGRWDRHGHYHDTRGARPHDLPKAWWVGYFDSYDRCMDYPQGFKHHADNSPCLMPGMSEWAKDVRAECGAMEIELGRDAE